MASLRLPLSALCGSCYHRGLTDGVPLTWPHLGPCVGVPRFDVFVRHTPAGRWARGPPAFPGVQRASTSALVPFRLRWPRRIRRARKRPTLSSTGEGSRAGRGAAVLGHGGAVQKAEPGRSGPRSGRREGGTLLKSSRFLVLRRLRKVVHFSELYDANTVRAKLLSRGWAEKCYNCGHILHSRKTNQPTPKRSQRRD